MSTYRTGLMALLLAAGIVTVLSAQQTAHQGHGTKSGKMLMPTMNDGQFVEMMKKHHEDGVALAKLEESRGARDDVKTLAAKIRQGQERDLEELRTKHANHLTPQGTAGHGDHDAAMRKHHGMMEQMTSASKQRLENASGSRVDQAFLQEMAKHHEMALAMIANTRFKDDSLRTLSQKMATAQEKEIKELKALERAR